MKNMNEVLYDEKRPLSEKNSKVGDPLDSVIRWE